MATDAIAVLHVADATRAVDWYRRLGFEVDFEHRFEPGLPLYVGVRRDGAQLHLSEHAGDATPDTLVFVWVDDLDAVAAEFSAVVTDQPWAREIGLIDPDGNRLRIAQPVGVPDVDTALGAGTAERLVALETAMWQDATRGDRAWLDAHLADDFTEFGASGRTYSRQAMLDTIPEAGIDPIEIQLPLDDLVIRPLGRDAALVTYRSDQPDRPAHRASVWRRVAGQWRLAFHQGTPVG